MGVPLRLLEDNHAILLPPSSQQQCCYCQGRQICFCQYSNWRGQPHYHHRGLRANHVKIWSHHTHTRREYITMIYRVSQKKNALSELPFWETGFEGTWPSIASW